MWLRLAPALRPAVLCAASEAAGPSSSSGGGSRPAQPARRRPPSAPPAGPPAQVRPADASPQEPRSHLPASNNHLVGSNAAARSTRRAPPGRPRFPLPVVVEGHNDRIAVQRAVDAEVRGRACPSHLLSVSAL